MVTSGGSHRYLEQRAVHGAAAIFAPADSSSDRMIALSSTRTATNDLAGQVREHCVEELLISILQIRQKRALARRREGCEFLRKRQTEDTSSAVPKAPCFHR